jgi:hypothetical protein
MRSETISHTITGTASRRPTVIAFGSVLTSIFGLTLCRSLSKSSLRGHSAVLGRTIQMLLSVA